MSLRFASMGGLGRLVNAHRYGGVAAGGGTSIDTTKILRWWENGNTTSKTADETVLANSGSTSSETVGPWSTVWSGSWTGESVSSAASPASWNAYTIALVVKWDSQSGRFLFRTNASNLYDFLALGTSDNLALKCNGGTAVDYARTTGSWLSFVVVKTASDLKIYENTTLKLTATAGANTPSSWDIFLAAAFSSDLACIAIMDEAWGAQQIADFHNDGNFRAYADLGAGGGYLVEDTFTDTSGTNLTAHTPDTDTPGNGWTTLDGVECRIYTDGVQAEAAGNRGAAIIDSEQSDVIVEADFVVESSDSFRTASLYFRVTDANNLWRVLMSARDGANPYAFFVQRKVGGSSTSLFPTSYGGSNQNILGGTTYNVKVVTSGDDILVKLDDSTILTINDSSNNTATAHGIGSDRTKASLGALIDNFRITDNS